MIKWVVSRLRCAYGSHEWGDWGSYSIMPPNPHPDKDTVVLGEERSCKRCDSLQVRNIREYTVTDKWDGWEHERVYTED